MEAISPYLEHLPGAIKILHLGSGTSDLHTHLRQHGFFDVTNIDYEPLALERGQQLENDRFGNVRTKYVIVDATRLQLEEKYGVVIDKSTADAIACGADDAVFSIAKGICRCLNDDGFRISLSYSPWRFEHVQSLFSGSHQQTSHAKTQVDRSGHLLLLLSLTPTGTTLMTSLLNWRAGKLPICPSVGRTVTAKSACMRCTVPKNLVGQYAESMIKKLPREQPLWCQHLWWPG
jgi:SAM-dependent methyltransferase